MAGPTISGRSEGVQAVAVDPSGNPWIIGDNAKVYHHTASGWQDMGIQATSIAVGANGAAWITDTNYQAGPGGYLVWTWTGSSWAEAPGASGNSIAVDSSGNPWITNSGPIYEFTVGQTTGTLGTSPNAIYVESLYEQLLHRSADPGASYWVGLLNQGVAPSTVVQTLETSSEYLSNVVTGIYEHYLNRAPDPGGLNAWVGALQSGATIEQVIEGFIASPEFYQVQGGGTNAGFVTVFYKDILNRAPDPGGYAYWLNALNSGSITPAGMAAGFLTSQEYRIDLIGLDYQLYLGRLPDAGGLDAWVQAMQAGLTDQTVLAAILGSGEGFADWS